MNKIYTRSFFAKQIAESTASAEVIVPLVLEVVPAVHSVADIGCGTGTWLSVFAQNGVAEIFGVDGEWAVDHLVIPRENFRAVDMTDGEIGLHKRYDLAMSVEVAEHLPGQAAEAFVRNLTDAADVVLFSAAVPHQGGQGHINEQWPTDWAALFARRGYVPADVIRARIWDNEAVACWYRQNIMLFVSEQHTAKLNLAESKQPLNLVHPAMWDAQAKSRDKHQAKLRGYKKQRVVALIAGLAVGLVLGYLLGS